MALYRKMTKKKGSEQSFQGRSKDPICQITLMIKEREHENLLLDSATWSHGQPHQMFWWNCGQGPDGRGLKRE